MSQGKLLFLAQTLPFPPDGGVHIRTYHLLRILSDAFEVDALCFYRRAARSTSHSVEQRVQELRAYASVEAFPIPQEESRARRVWDHARSVIRRRPYTVFAYESDRFHQNLNRLLGEGDYDIVHVDSLDLSGYLSELAAHTIVCGHHNVESELLGRRAATASNPLYSAYLRHQSELLAREEERWCPRVKLNVTVSERDRRILKKRVPGARCSVVPNGVDVDYFRPKPGDQAGIVFVGGCTWFPNRDALDYFAFDILPLIRARMPDVPVRWVGRADDSLRKHFKREHDIEMTGYVEDIRPHVTSAACYVVPLRVGGGTRLKILDAWAMGKAVVSTSQGCEGLEAADGRNILIRDDPEAFSKAVCQVLEEPELRRRLGREARATAEELYSWEAIGREMVRCYRGLTAPDGREADVSSDSTVDTDAQSGRGK